jgi:hypothetical protein
VLSAVVFSGFAAAIEAEKRTWQSRARKRALRRKISGV